MLTFSGPFRAEDCSSVARKVTFQLGRKVTLLLGANTIFLDLTYQVARLIAKGRLHVCVAPCKTGVSNTRHFYNVDSRNFDRRFYLNPSVLEGDFLSRCNSSLWIYQKC
jgi:hypothetical protein